jgi:two-component sensor histidine kinase
MALAVRVTQGMPEAAICKITMGKKRIYSVLLRDITERTRQETHARLLIRELEHRVHNILARIQMLVERSEDDEGISLRKFREGLLDRIKALARAQGLLGRTNWLVIHELTTNAVKYGALSVPGGRISVSWRQVAAEKPGEEIVVQWIEQGGREVKPPQREGYGTILIRELLTFEFEASVDQRYAPKGLTCQISLPVDRVLEKPGSPVGRRRRQSDRRRR